MADLADLTLPGVRAQREMLPSYLELVGVAPLVGARRARFTALVARATMRPSASLHRGELIELTYISPWE